MLYSLCNKVLCYGVESAEKPRCRVFFFLCALDFASYRERFEKLWCASPFCVLRYFIFVPACHQRDIYARKQGQGLLLFYGLARYTFESRIRKPRKGLRFKPILGALWKTPSKIGVFAVCFRFWIYHGKSRCHAVKTVLIIASLSLSILCAPDGWGWSVHAANGEGREVVLPDIFNERSAIVFTGFLPRKHLDLGGITLYLCDSVIQFYIQILILSSVCSKNINFDFLHNSEGVFSFISPCHERILD